MNFGSPFLSRQNSLDRYIPRRKSQDIECAHYRLQRSSSASNSSGLSDNDDSSSYTVTEPPDSPFSPQPCNGLTPFWSRMNSVSLGSPNSRILNFSDSQGIYNISPTLFYFKVIIFDVLNVFQTRHNTQIQDQIIK